VVVVEEEKSVEALLLGMLSVRKDNLVVSVALALLE
jgi:hypothetical protein